MLGRSRAVRHRLTLRAGLEGLVQNLHAEVLRVVDTEAGRALQVRLTREAERGRELKARLLKMLLLAGDLNLVRRQLDLGRFGNFGHSARLLVEAQSFRTA